MRIWIWFFALLIFGACDSHSESISTTMETEANLDATRIAALERLREHEPLDAFTAEGVQWLTVQEAILQEYARRYEADGYEQSVAWLDRESRRAQDELIERWTPEQEE